MKFDLIITALVVSIVEIIVLNFGLVVGREYGTLENMIIKFLEGSAKALKKGSDLRNAGKNKDHLW